MTATTTTTTTTTTTMTTRTDNKNNKMSRTRTWDEDTTIKKRSWMMRDDNGDE